MVGNIVNYKGQIKNQPQLKNAFLKFKQVYKLTYLAADSMVYISSSGHINVSVPSPKQSRVVHS